ncbi:MAG: hypothetical protein IKF80_10805 [Erysipelotrichaceae bacterium]|nr:hypothetical protein [Erysipelotrichaceae bacterium]
MKKKMLRYFLICMGTYLILAAAEIFLLGPLVDMITENFWGRFAVYCGLLLIVDPLVTRFVADRFDLSERIMEDEDA